MNFSRFIGIYIKYFMNIMTDNLQTSDENSNQLRQIMDIMSATTRDDVDIMDMTYEPNLMLQYIELQQGEYIIHNVERISTYDKNYHYNSQIVTSFGNIYDNHIRCKVGYYIRDRPRFIDLFKNEIASSRPNLIKQSNLELNPLLT